MNRGQFEQEFNSRTLAYLPAFREDNRPVVVRLGRDARSPNGHALVLGLVNQLARAHQRLVVVGVDDEPLLCKDVFASSTLQGATIELARAVNPYIVAQPGALDDEPLLTIAIGQTDEPADLRVGCTGWCATFGTEATVDSTKTSLLGAMLASCITAAFAFHRLLGRIGTPEGSFSLWHYGSPGTMQGPDVTGALDVGRVLQVGAGGVGAALDFWLALVGVNGTWTIVDGDVVEISNLNRQLSFLAKDTGFPNRAAVNKATAAAAVLGWPAHAEPGWYGDNPEVSYAEYDVVLALANERGIRGTLQSLQSPVLLHATTSPNWEAQFHRHVAGHDDCISCRIPEAPSRLRCSEARVDHETGADAALPFLSGAAGVMLLAGLVRLQYGRLLESDRNYVALNLAEPPPITQQARRNCRVGCTGWSASEVRARIGKTSRFAPLDPARRHANPGVRADTFARTATRTRLKP